MKQRQQISVIAIQDPVGPIAASNVENVNARATIYFVGFCPWIKKVVAVPAEQ